MNPRKTRLHAPSRSFVAKLVGPITALSIALAGCGGGTPTSPTVNPTPGSGTPTPAPGPSSGGAATLPAPTLVSPINGGYVQQNDPATTCRYDPVYGYGFVVTFVWGPPAGVTSIESYEVQLKHPYASVPLLDERVAATKYTYVACSVVPGDEQGWQWKVRARSVDGRESDWSQAYFLNFTNCRLANGLRCAEQPPQ
jgi:hypothetical protein